MTGELHYSTILAHCPLPKDLEALGVALGQCLQPGDFVGFIGDLGAGKTSLIRAMVRGLCQTLACDSEPRVSSPSYTLSQTYELSSLSVHHMDLYRLEDEDDLESMGYWDFIEDPESIALVEWIDQIPEALPSGALIIEIAIQDNEARLVELKSDQPLDLFKIYRCWTTHSTSVLP